jgi:hypothetical protein
LTSKNLGAVKARVTEKWAGIAGIRTEKCGASRSFSGTEERHRRFRHFRRLAIELIWEEIKRVAKMTKFCHRNERCYFSNLAVIMKMTWMTNNLRIVAIQFCGAVMIYIKMFLHIFEFIRFYKILQFFDSCL